MLLVLLISTMLVLPQGVDLELCLGNEGHIDFSLNDCQDDASQMIPARERLQIYDTAHHDECIDVTIACNTGQRLTRTDGISGSLKSTLKQNHCKASIFRSEYLDDSVGANLTPNIYPVLLDDFPSPQLDSLRTVVLLI